MTKSGAKTVIPPSSQIEVTLACDAGTTNGGTYGLHDLFSSAGEFAAKRLGRDAPPPVRITHWRADEDGPAVRCTYDTLPGLPHAPNVVIVPNNHRGIAQPDRDSPFVDWLRIKRAEGVVLAAVCGGVFILAKTGLLCPRMSRVRELLEFSRSTIDEIAAHVGYDDARGFRRVFRNIVGLAPSKYCRRFSRLGAEATPK